MRVNLQPGYILHHRAYRETSVIVDVFTPEFGVIAGVVKGVRQSKSRLKPLVQPFLPLLFSWVGKTELVQITQIEPNGFHGRLQGNCLLSAFYLNELLMRILHKYDPHPALYTNYIETLLELHATPLLQKALRIFEKKLLENIGYGLPLEHDAFTHEDIAAHNDYYFHMDRGFELCSEQVCDLPKFAGLSLLALANETLHDEKSLADAKRLMRLVLAPLLGKHTILTRELFVSIKRKLEERTE